MLFVRGMETGTLTVTLGTDWEGEGASPPREIPDEVSAGPGISPITMKCLEIEITVIKKVSQSFSQTVHMASYRCHTALRIRIAMIKTWFPRRHGLGFHGSGLLLRRLLGQMGLET